MRIDDEDTQTHYAGDRQDGHMHQARSVNHCHPRVGRDDGGRPGAFPQGQEEDGQG